MTSTKYQSTTAAARRWGVSRQRVAVWLADGRIAGARCERDPLGRVVHLIPITAKRPTAMAPGPPGGGDFKLGHYQEGGVVTRL